jgi:hypothetical protein
MIKLALISPPSLDFTARDPQQRFSAANFFAPLDFRSTFDYTESNLCEIFHNG